MQACSCNKLTCSKVLTKLCMLLRQCTTHQGFSRRFLLLPKIQQRALTFFWPLNASVIGHNGCRISVIGGHVARSNYKKVKGYAKWVLTFQACAEVSSRENQNLLTWQKKILFERFRRDLFTCSVYLPARCTSARGGLLYLCSCQSD